MTPVLIASQRPFPGGQQFSCDCCPNRVFDHPENIQRVRDAEGFVICEVCAITLKIEMPDKFPKIEAQMWHGHLRKPEPTPQWKSFIEFINRKP